jgi:hypothetical protein
MKKQVEYAKSNTEWSESDYLTDSQRHQLIQEKIARYKQQSDMNYGSLANVRANER